jgi:hypothetical protein
MFFLFFCVFACKLLLIVILLMIANIVYFGDLATSCYNQFTTLQMLVTTRSEFKRLQNVNYVHSFTSTSGSILSSQMSSLLPSGNDTTTAPLTVSNCNDNTTTSSLNASIFNSCHDHGIMSLSNLSMVSSSTPSISKFQHLEISNSPPFDPGIRSSLCHSLPVSNLSIMESDCEDVKNSAMGPTKQEHPPDLNTFLSVIKNHIEDATLKMTFDFHHVIVSNDNFKQDIIDANENFKREVQDELAELRALLHQHQNLIQSTIPIQPTTMPLPPVMIPSASNSGVSVVPTTAPVSSATNTSSSPVVMSTSTDQVLLLLTESFTKMALALAEKNPDTKAEWPKFSGDPKNFPAWYLAVMTQLSIVPWHELYDSSRNDVVLTTTNTTLNEKLYSKLILALESNALQHVVSQKYLGANGLLVLQDLTQTYNPRTFLKLLQLRRQNFGAL